MIDHSVDRFAISADGSAEVVLRIPGPVPDEVSGLLVAEHQAIADGDDLTITRRWPNSTVPPRPDDALADAVATTVISWAARQFGGVVVAGATA
ncbi:hypothetical protein [Patulibacter defluvii]|uniref:hypothetical protein n=1 Tax=Patulibacter defluvii TaxID=3095358 RepID=UPI002A759400|nr:hypothetical protein [Patulibacter sp. DM4]